MAKGQAANEKQQNFLITAKVDLAALPEKDDSGRILIPTAARELCEFAIDALCNVVAAFNGCSRSILSPSPSVALECATQEERDYLEDSKGPAFFRASVPRTHHGPKEEAAHIPRAPFGYTREEIGKWIELRHPLSHADLREAKGIATTSDVRRYVLRSEQAVLDVLFNKERWGDKSVTRRSVWTPDALTTSESGKMVVKQGSKLSLRFRLYDVFDVSPRNLTATVTTIEDSWYVRVNEDNVPKLPASAEGAGPAKTT